MQRKSLVIFFLLALVNSLFVYGVYAQETADTNVVDPTLVEVPEDAPATPVEDTSSETLESELESSEESELADLIVEAEGFDEELSVEAGITPDSGAYFIEDKILAPFRDDAVNRERKIAEMREMVQRGDMESARIAFEKYQKYADRFEHGVSPDQREEALRSSEAIRGTFIRDIAQNLPPGEKDEFVRDIMLQESDISTAAEIAGKIKELCEQLAKLDPLEYSRVCSVERDAPDWRKELNRDLTEEQRKEALEFGEIMSQCFETAGQKCRCEEIQYPDFAETCSIAAPLATACEIEGNEEACEQLDDLEMPELPAYLEDIMDELEGRVSEDKYGIFFPPECEEAGARSPKECAKIMIQAHAPEECRQALLDADVRSEREGREICEKIMFEKNAPKECIEAGVTDPRECGKIMFRANAPQECIDAGITGENRGDPRRCQEIMMSQFGGPGEGPPGPPRGGFGGNCARILDPQERLACYDGAGQYVQEYRGDFEENFREFQETFEEFQEDLREREGYQEHFRQDFSQPYYPQQYGDFREGQFYPPPEFQYPNNFQPPEGFQYPDNFQPPQDHQQQLPEGYMPPPPEYYQQPTTGEQPPYPYPQSPEGYIAPPTGTYEQQPPTTESTYSTTEPASSSPPSSEPSPSEPGQVTGGVIGTNKFLRWFWR